MDELVYYLLRINTQDIRVEIQKAEPYYIVSISGQYDPAQYKKIHDIKRMLTEGPRDKSIEAEYWELMGLNSSTFDSELQLIGMMADHSSMTLEGNRLNIEIQKQI